MSAAYQRRRLLAATVAAVSERGYAASTVADLARISGVGRGDFYKYFGSKQECFFCAVDTLYDEAMRQVRLGYRSEQEWEARMRAAFKALVGVLIFQPEASRMCLVDVYEAGPAGGERADRGAAGFERLLRQSAESCGRGRRMPGAVITGVVRGIQMLIHDRLRRRAVEELPELMEELLEWGLSYQRPAVALRRVTRRVEAHQYEPSPDPVERLLVAFADAAAEKGYRAVSVNELAPRAGTSLRTLYANFSGKEEAFLACMELVRERMRAIGEPAYARAEDWAGAISSGNDALLEFLAAEPVLARAALIEVLAAGSAALEQRDEAIKRFAVRLGPGFELAPEVPKVATEAIAFGRYALIQHQIVRYGPQALPRLGPALTFFVLAPFLGGDQAARVANGAAAVEAEPAAA